jgi:DNA-binding response OmpR family regulator
MKVLLLEDEAMLRSSIKEFLEDLDCLVDDFYDGLSALKAFENCEYDALLLDINVPNLDGFGLLESVRKKDELKPVIFITAMTDIEDITKAYNLGCSDYIKKPFGLQELWLRLKNIVSIVGTKEQTMLKLSNHYSYNKERKALLFQGNQFDMSKKHMGIIELLVNNIGFCVPLDSFRNIVWGREDIDDATIRTEINRLKKLLNEDLIVNIKGVGYRIEKP